MVVAFLVVVASAGLLQTAVEVARGQSVGALDVFRQKPTSANLRLYEHGLQDASVVARLLRPVFQFVQFAWLRDGGEKAVIGREGWLFYKPGVDATLAYSSSNPGTNDPVPAILAWREELQNRHIQLLVVIAPNKESIYPDRLSRSAAAGTVRPSAQAARLMAQLKEANVECVDLFSAFANRRKSASVVDRSELYLQSDSHWTPAGAELAAETVARHLLATGWATRGEVPYEEQLAPITRAGDIVRMMQSPWIENVCPPEPASCARIVRHGTLQPYADDPSSEILILGDSFLRIYQQDEPGAAGFIAHLAKELKQPVTSLVNDGGASTLVRQELFRRPGLLKGKRVVIWEFVERDIRLGTEGWQMVPLPDAF